MINSVITIGGHLIDRVILDDQGSPGFSLPPFYPGIYQFKLKLFSKADDGSLAVVYPNVTALNASIGLVYAEPRAGTFKLRYGPGHLSSEAINFNEDAEDFKTKLAALNGTGESGDRGLSAVYQPSPSTWMCKFDTPTPPIPLEGVEVDLDPETFVRVRQFYQSDEYWVEIRLMQGPIASTNAHSNILPPPVTVREIRHGYTQIIDDFTTIVVNEVQSITVPPGFAGTYIIKFQGRQTRPMSVNDGAANIQTAMNAMFTDNVVRFTCSNPEENNCYVEFVGPLGGQGFDLLGITNIVDENKIDTFFEIDLNTAEVAAALQTSKEVSTIFEVALHIKDPAVETDPGQDLVLFQADATILRPLQWEGLQAAAPINWLFPPNPKDYIPFDINQVITGDQSYSTSFGDGLLTDFVINHMLGTDAVSVTIRENASDGRQLKDEEYSITFDNGNALTVHMPVGSPPATNSLLIIIQATGTVSAFLNHHHPIEAIDGLGTVIDEILIRLSALEAYIPTLGGQPPGGGPPPFGGDGTGTVMTVAIPDIWNVVPTNRMPGKDKPKDVTTLPSQGFLLPAVHEAIALGTFTADVTGNKLVLDVPYAGTPALVDGQRVQIVIPDFQEVGQVTWDSDLDTVGLPANPLVNGRRVQFTGDGLPTSVARNFTYYVINAASDSFQISSTLGGDFLPISDDFVVTEENFVNVRPEPPDGLEEGVDYFMIAPTSTQFAVSATLNGTPGAPIDIGPGAGYPPQKLTTIHDAPALDQFGRLPLATDPTSAQYIGHAYSVRDTIPLVGGRGIRATTVYPGDIVASDGRLWYPVTRSDSPGKNSFYPTKMENEIFRLAISDKMLAAGMRLQITFDLEIRMYKHTSNTQYLIVVEWADLPQTLVPTPTGPNLQNVVWSNVPILQQRIIVTELSFVHEFGVQVIRLTDGRMKTNKKIYGVEVAGDSIPPSANFAIRSRLIEFDTEDNVKDAVGLVYYSVTKAVGDIVKQGAA
jgi:hypothetical protein